MSGCGLPEDSINIMSADSSASSQSTANSYLRELDILLKSASSSKNVGFLGEDKYGEQQMAFEKITNQRDLISTYLAKRTCARLTTSTEHLHQSYVYRVCSLGCGDGRLDKEYISKIIAERPEANIEFLGVDINVSSCRLATELFSAMAQEHGERFKFNIINCDILDVSTKEHGVFDMVVAIHTLYFVPVLNDVLKKCQGLKKSNGEAIIIIATRDPTNELFRLFWYHENNREVNFSHAVSENLTQLGITYEVEEITGELDFTECFKNGFQDRAHSKILDFITHTTLSKYSTEVRDTCVKYIASLAKGKPDKYIIERSAHIIIIKG